MQREKFNAADYLVARQIRAGNGHCVAVVALNRTLSYAELDREVRRAARGLRALGIRPEERIAMCMADDVDLLVLILATMHIGAVAVPCSTMLTPGELGELLTDSRTRIVFDDTRFSDVVEEAVASTTEVECIHTLDQLLARGMSAGASDADGEPYPTWPDSPAVWQYTSGTTGTPKAAMHRHADIRIIAQAYGHGVLNIGSDDRFLSVAKLFFGYGMGNSLVFPLSTGATTLLEPGNPTAELFAERARRDRPTLLFATPAFWTKLLASHVQADAFASVRLGISAGEALPAPLYYRMRSRFGFEILDGLGSTEMMHIYISNRPGRVHPGSSGWPLGNYDVELRDEFGRRIDEDEVAGELYVRGDSAASGYWCRTDATRRVFIGEWVRSGDIYRRNLDASYSFLGRTDDMLKSSGIWVSPIEIEERLLAHSTVAEVAVVAMSDSDNLEKPVAYIVPASGAKIDKDELVRWCRDVLAPFKLPRAILELAELPKTATGKVRRDILRARSRPHG